MVGLAKLFSYSEKTLSSLFLKLLPELLRLIVLAIYILFRNCRHLRSRHRYISIINKKTSKFCYGKNPNSSDDQCSICLFELQQGDEARVVADCRHVFHSLCLEKWLCGPRPACPLCRTSVVPETAVEEYHRMQIEQQNDDGIDKELALILLKALHAGSRMHRWI